jgi:hypothetical protein
MALDRHPVANFLRAYAWQQIMRGGAANRRNNRAGAEKVAADTHSAGTRAEIDSSRLAGLESHRAEIESERLAGNEAGAQDGDRA